MAFSTKITDEWRRYTKSERARIVQDAILEQMADAVNNDYIEVLRVEGAGRVIIRLVRNMETVERGRLLLDLERQLRNIVGPWIEVFLEPRVDENRLRQLRGVKV